jgi:hypothetical protein
MNLRTSLLISVHCALFLLVSGHCSAFAQELKNLDHITLKSGEVVVVKSDVPEKLEADLEIPGGVTVSTNGIVKADGKEIELKEGQKLTLDGYWLGDDGTLVLFPDHYTVRDGKVFLVKGGIFTSVDQEVVFKNGTRLKTDGNVNTTGGKVMRLQNGQSLTLEGQPLQEKDHVIMKDKKLLIQRDGGIVTIAPGVTMGMSDGTKVKSDGAITTLGGQTFTLKEGQRLTLDGATLAKF